MTAIPKSKAKTANGLLSEIRKLILAEPKRYDQFDWLSFEVRGLLAPACGTVGCVGGWTVFLKQGRRSNTPSAAGILGLSDSQADELFRGGAAGRRRGRDGVETEQSIAAHARRGAAHIRRFQKKHATQLRAKLV